MYIIIEAKIFIRINANVVIASFLKYTCIKIQISSYKGRKLWCCMAGYETIIIITTITPKRYQELMPVKASPFQEKFSNIDTCRGQSLSVFSSFELCSG